MDVILNKKIFVASLLLLTPCVNCQDAKPETAKTNTQDFQTEEQTQTSPSADEPTETDLQKKEISQDIAVIIAAAEGGMVWKDKLRQAALNVKYSLPIKTIPIEIVYGESPRGLQRAINRVSRRDIKKLIIIPAYLSSHNDKIEYLKYLLAIRQTPPHSYLKPDRYFQNSLDLTSFFKPRKIFEPKKEYSHIELKQVETKLPIVMTSAMDADMLEETLTNALKPFKAIEQDLCLAVATVATNDEKYNELITRALKNPSQKLAQKSNFISAELFLLTPELKTQPHKNTIKKLKAYIKNNLLKCKTIVAGYSLYYRHLDKTLSDELFGSFYIYGKTATPSAKQLETWLKGKILRAQDMPANKRFAPYEERSEWEIF
jgi:hypothetical protein